MAHMHAACGVYTWRPTQTADGSKRRLLCGAAGTQPGLAASSAVAIQARPRMQPRVPARLLTPRVPRRASK